MRTVQIVGKITGLDKSEYVKKFKRAENELKNCGYRVINPITLCAPIYANNPDKSDEEIWPECVDATLESIENKADAICLLDDVMQSEGSRREIAKALELGKVVASLNYLAF